MQSRCSLRLALVLACFAALGGLARAEEEEPVVKMPDATLSITGKSLAAGVGYTWGTGTLRYKGKSWAVKVDGLTAGQVGISSLTANGSVYDLKKLGDIDGNYTAVVGGGPMGGGGGGLVMRNQNGVEMHAEGDHARREPDDRRVSGVKLTLKK